MDIGDRPELRSDLVFRQIDADVIVYDPVHDQTVLLNVTAAMVLDLCDGSRSIDEVATEVAATFSQEKKRVLEDVETIVNEVAEKGLFRTA